MEERAGDDALAGWLAGAAGGAAVALLIAPWAAGRSDDVVRAGAREAVGLARDYAYRTAARVWQRLDGAIREGQATAQRRRAELTAASQR